LRLEYGQKREMMKEKKWREIDEQQNHQKKGEFN